MERTSFKGFYFCKACALLDLERRVPGFGNGRGVVNIMVYIGTRILLHIGATVFLCASRKNG